MGKVNSVYTPENLQPAQWQRLGEGVAAMYASDGGGIDRSRLVTQRGVALSGAAVATTADRLKYGAG
jgi:hypothetical protein